jgi:acyl-CoA synthetase (AMP-forming)/AMP-acid ligase II
MNISLVLQMAADAEPERIGLVCEGRRWPYQALLRAAQGAAAGFAASGCSHVALLDASRAAAAVALFGAAIAGIPYVPLNYRLADADLAALLKRIAPAYIIGDVERIQRLNPDGGHQARTHAAFIAQAEQADGADAPAAEDDKAIAVQIFTSGTTAAPKAALLRHANLLSWLESRRCSVRSMPCAGSCCCRRSKPTPGWR